MDGDVVADLSWGSWIPIKVLFGFLSTSIKDVVEWTFLIAGAETWHCHKTI